MAHQATDRETQRRQVTCPRSHRRRWPRPPDLLSFRRRGHPHLLPRSGPSNPRLCVRGRAHPPSPRSIQPPSVWSLGAQPCTGERQVGGRSRSAARRQRPRPRAPHPSPRAGAAGAKARPAGSANASPRISLALGAPGKPGGSPARALQDEEAPGSSPPQGRARGERAHPRGMPSPVLPPLLHLSLPAPSPPSRLAGGWTRGRSPAQ